MPSFSVGNGVTDVAPKTVSNNDTGTIAAGGTLSAATAIVWAGGSTNPGVVIDNSGNISATTRGIDTSGSFTTGSFALVNHADADLIATNNDAFRINTNIANGTITVDNSGFIVSGALDASGHIIPHASGQALDFAAVASPTAVINIINHANGIIGASGDDAIRPGAGNVTITNDGLIDATASGSRAINLNASNLSNITSFHLTNGAHGVIQSQTDTVRITAGTLTPTASYTIDVDNAGTIMSIGTGGSNGQALDFNDLLSTNGHVSITNEATGLIQAADADAIRGGVNTSIDNYGRIIGLAATPGDGNDAIDFQLNKGGVVSNHAGGLIDGTRHGITGDNPVTVTNDANGVIKGEAGSGINLDTASDTTTTITNHGLITGNANGIADGDGVDVDGLISLINSGTIATSGHTDGILAEAISIGGGSIINAAGGVIDSVERAITVDDSNLGNAFAATTIDNEGIIHGGNGQAISITDTFADTLTNKNLIDGSVAMGGGDDTFNFYTGSSVTGAIDGGDGTDTLNLFGTGTGAVANLVNIEAIHLNSGDWTLGSEGICSVEFDGAATLRLASPLLADHHFEGTIEGFANVDVIDLEGIGLASKATLGPGNLLTLSGGASGPVTLQLDPGQSFTGFVFQISSDGTGGTDLSLAKVINGGNGNSVLTGTDGNDVITAGNGNDTVNSGDGNDSVSGGNGNDVLQAGNGNSSLDGGNGDDVLEAGNGHNNLTGGNGNDTFTVGNGNNSLDGGNGNDALTVGNGNNSITGGNGNDTIHVGTGNNSLTGGNGNDTFVFGPGFGKNVVTDFSHGDHLEFDGVFQNFQAVQAASHQVGADAVISLDADHSVTLVDVSIASLHASDFLLH